MDYCLPGSSIHGIFQARILEWVAISFSRGSSRPKDRTRVSGKAGRCFTAWATSEVRSPVPFWPLFLCLPQRLFFQIHNQKQYLRLVSTLFFLPYTLSFWKALTHVALCRHPWKPACSSWTLFNPESQCLLDVPDPPGVSAPHASHPTHLHDSET